MAMTSDVSCSLLELDYAGIEAVITGWAMWRHLGDSQGAQHYIRLCRLGLHGIVTALKLNQPINLTLPDPEIAAQAARVKATYAYDYDVIKHANHGTHYGLTPFGMVQMFPDHFRTVKEAAETQGFLFKAAPTLPGWHNAVRKRAREVGYLGGPTKPGVTASIWDHPFGYKHWFWDVLSYKPVDELTARKWLRDPGRAGRIITMHGRYFKIDWGGDSKRCIAFFPQSIAAGILKRAELRLFHPDSPDYIGDAYFGRTPLLHPIHDSLFLHVPNRILERVAAICARVMQEAIPELPIPSEWAMGHHLRIGVEAKAGRTWDKAAMTKLYVEPIIYGVPHPEDPPVLAREDEDQEQWDALQRAVA
jgi:hypothetical protein